MGFGPWRQGRLPRVIALALVTISLLAACAPGARRAPVEAVEPAPTGRAAVLAPARATAVAQPPTIPTARMLVLVNEARASARRCGTIRMPAAAPLHWDDALARAAAWHSHAMAAQGFVAHVSPTGSTVGDRVAATGYVARTWGETIAAGYVDPAETVAGFLASPSHCEVLMAQDFEALGAALFEHEASAYGSYWTLVFAAPR